MTLLKQSLHAKLDAYILKHRQGWTFDTAQRYLEVRSLILNKSGLASNILDVGSSGMGLAVYWKGHPGKIVDVDPAFPAYRMSEQQVQGLAETLPFPARAFEVVVSIDMLEHVPPAQRPAVIADMLRVASKLFILAVPEGPEAVAQDAEVARLFRQARGQEFAFVEEHILYGLPEARQVEGWIAEALVHLHRAGQVQIQRNANLRLRFTFMKWLILDQWGLVQKSLLILMPWLYRLNWGRAYRKFFIVCLEA